MWVAQVFHNIVTNQMLLIPLQHNDNYICNYSRTSLSGHSEKRTHSLERTKL